MKTRPLIIKLLPSRIRPLRLAVREAALHSLALAMFLPAPLALHPPALAAFGTVLTTADTGLCGFSGEGVLASDATLIPCGLAVDPDGTLSPPDAAPQGFSGPDWASIRRKYEQHRSAALPTDGASGTLQARNPGQHLQTRFDGRGFLTRPDADGWRWGLELRSYGFPGQERDIAADTKCGCVSAVGSRVAYDWDDTLQEWFVNDRQGLEHGFTLSRRPAGAPTLDSETAPLNFILAVRGGLRAEVQSDGRGVRIVNARGATTLTYGGLKAWDAMGRTLPARMEVRDSGLALLVDDRAAVYPVVIDPLVFPETKLAASDAADSDGFGYSVAISGDTVVVGAALEDNARGVDAGSAYVFVRSGTAWNQQQKLTASSVAANDQFGNSVAISGDTVVVGTPGDDLGAATNAGSTYVFKRSGATWNQQQKLTATDAAVNDGFGCSVAISGDTIVVGALGDSNAGGEAAGSAYVFVRSGATWSQQQKLTASDAATRDLFGNAVAISGDTVVVGALGDSNAGGEAAGSAYVFVRSGTTWNQQQKLTASDAAAGARFGSSVGISGDTVVVGALGDDDAGLSSGSAYVFVRSGATWSQQQKLTASDAAEGDRFGSSVAISGNTVVVGALGDDDAGLSSGSAYVFVRSGTTWTEQPKLTASDSVAYDFFGVSVAVSGDTVAVGAVGDIDAGGTDAGAAYLFELSPAFYAVLLAATGDATRERDLDARQFKNALHRFPGVKEANISVVHSALAAYQAMSAINRKIKPGDTLLFFYVGHGDWNDQEASEPDVETSTYVRQIAKPGVSVNRGDEYLAVNSRDMFRPDGTRNPAAEYITDDDLHDLFLAVPNSAQVKKIAMLSACFSGGFWAGTNGIGSDSGDLSAVPNTALFASVPESDTGQAESNVTGDGRSLFVKALEDALNEMADQGLSLSFRHLQDKLALFYTREHFDPSHSGDFVVDGSWFDTPLHVSLDQVELSAFSAATTDFDKFASLTGPPLPPGQLLQPQLSGGNLRLSFLTVSNQSYTLQASMDLASTNWFNLTNVNGNGLLMQVTVAISNGVPQEFLRLKQP